MVYKKNLRNLYKWKKIPLFTANCNIFSIEINGLLSSAGYVKFVSFISLSLVYIFLFLRVKNRWGKIQIVKYKISNFDAHSMKCIKCNSIRLNECVFLNVQDTID